MPACFEPLSHCPLDVASRGQVMGQQFGLAFDDRDEPAAHSTRPPLITSRVAICSASRTRDQPQPPLDPRPQGRQARPLSRLHALVKMAEALGCYAEYVEESEDIRPALQRAWKKVERGMVGFVNVKTDYRARHDGSLFQP
jgi:hypothetical protein